MRGSLIEGGLLVAAAAFAVVGLAPPLSLPDGGIPVPTVPLPTLVGGVALLGAIFVHRYSTRSAWYVVADSGGLVVQRPGIGAFAIGALVGWAAVHFRLVALGGLVP